MKPSSIQEGAPSPVQRIGLVLLLVGLLAAAFLPALDVYLVGDDFEWLNAAFEIPMHPLSSFDRVNSMCRPLVKWSFLVDYLVWGQNASGYMLTNLTIHVLNAALLALLLMRVIGRPLLAAGAAAAFALSPLHSEAVLWASSRGDTLLLTFWLAALLALSAEERASGRHRAAAVLILVLVGAGAKESWVVFPFIATAFLVLVRRRSPTAAIRQLGWIWLVLGLYLGIFVLRPMFSGASNPAYYADFSPLPALVKVSRLLLAYCGLGGLRLSSFVATMCAGAITACVLTAIIRTGDRRALWAATWTAATLALAAPFPDVALRHNYLPLAGFWMTLALLGADLIATRETVSVRYPPRARPALLIAVGLAVLVIEGRALQLEIDDYRRYGEFHRELVGMVASVEPRIPRDRPVLFIDHGRRRAVAEAAASVEGVPKTFFVRRDAIWQLVFLPPLANFVGHPFSEMLRPVPGDEVPDFLGGDLTVLVFTDDGFHLATGAPKGLVAAVAATGRLPEAIAMYRYEPWRSSMN